MGLFSFLKPASDGANKSVDSTDDVQVLRQRARRRLIGAAVLVAIAVVGFPLVFETQPRPIPIDLPIEIPRKDAAPPLNVPESVPQSAPQTATPPASRDVGAAAPAAAPVPAASAPAAASVATAAPQSLPRASALVLPLPPRVTEHGAVKALEPPADTPVGKPADKPADKPVEKRAATATLADAARAQALLDGRDAPPRASPAQAPRFIVQVGAFAEAKAAQEMRHRVEKLGLRTYAQDVQTPDGRRTRVRLGPFSGREEADRALAKLRAGGVTGSILTL